MMIGMMLPSAAPAVLDLANLQVTEGDENYVPRNAFAFMAGYLAVWVRFSLLAVVLNRLFDSLHVLSPMMEIRSLPLSLLLLATAGAYQFTPLKRVSLKACRCLTVGTFHSGFRSGLRNGIGCLGCCRERLQSRNLILRIFELRGESRHLFL